MLLSSGVVKTFHSEEMESLCASGTEEEYDERERLLTGIVDLVCISVSPISLFLIFCHLFLSLWFLFCIQVNEAATEKDDKSEKEKRKAQKKGERWRGHHQRR